jgi:magnesium-protoporphyrin O-methyltransferase
VLDLGCGAGGLAVEAVRHGAARASGYDLSPTAIEEARRLARDRGVADRVRFEVGDGARVDLPVADVVVLNRVFCCYPDAAALVERSLGAARSVYAFTIPRSSGPVGALVRAQTRVANACRRLRSRKFGGFRVFVHDLGPIDAAVRAAGFAPLRREHRGLVWDLAVYAR